ncbi:MAG: endonuclease III [Bacteroidetes bacterium]|nr:endonuclease III [Bacteroidota bacterium]MCL5026789.1 endonuclease III [Chloroflexota bacterium]
MVKLQVDSRAEEAARAEQRKAKAWKVHRLLLAEYGDREWHAHADPLSELIQTILSQQTSDVNSHRAFAELRSRFPSWEAVRDAPLEQVAAAIQGSGLSNIKAPRIQRVLREVSREGRLDLEFLRDMPTAEARAWLRSLSGVGPKTAACVLLFSLGKPALPVDTHVFRVSCRLGLILPRISVERAHDELEALLPPEAYYAFHINMITHGRRVCHAQRPAHELCVLQAECDYFLGEAIAHATMTASSDPTK